MTTKSPAGSATGIDLAALTAIQDRLALASRLCLSLAPKQAVGELLEAATNMPEWQTVRDALARATPQHPEAPAVQSATNIAWGHELQKRLMVADDQGDDDLHNLLGEAACCLASLVGRPDAAATPQHSVTEQASIDGDALYRAWHKVGADVAGLNFADFAAALDRPLASTAATQPEQAAKGELLAEDQRRAVINAVGAAWPTWFENTPLKVLNKLAWNIEQACVAALAIPASTAPTQPELALLNADELAALRRFDECAQDGEGWDVPKLMMQRLAEIGVVRRKSGNFYESTDFGQHVLAQPLSMQPGEKS